jgi:hypothetical protein
MNLHTKPIADSTWRDLIQALPEFNWQMGPWIAGGSARKLWSGLEWHTGDVDVFFANGTQFAQFKSKLEHDLLPRAVKTTGWDFLELHELRTNKTWFTPRNHVLPHPDYQAHKHMETENAVTYLIQHKDQDTPYKLQLIKAQYTHSLTELWASFDFTVSCFAADAHEVRTTAKAAQDCALHKLTLLNLRKPENLPMRVLKHMAYGFDADVTLLKQVEHQIKSGHVSWQPEY